MRGRLARRSIPRRRPPGLTPSLTPLRRVAPRHAGSTAPGPLRSFATRRSPRTEPAARRRSGRRTLATPAAEPPACRSTRRSPTVRCPDSAVLVEQSFDLVDHVKSPLSIANPRGSRRFGDVAVLDEILQRLPRVGTLREPISRHVRRPLVPVSLAAHVQMRRLHFGTVRVPMCRAAGDLKHLATEARRSRRQ